ncbi:LCP family protein, partial [candidate division WOR-3 bacterium]|nr:LCP family protein [candidate division WOR-3 bacterium]
MLAPLALLAAGLLLWLLLPRHRTAPTETPGLALSGTFNVLLVGSDARALGKVEREGHARNPRQERAHSDIVILCHFDLDSGRVSLVGLPRDLLVEVPGVTAAESATDFRRMEKLAHVLLIGGPGLLRRTVEGLLGVTIDRHVVFDFDSFRMTMGALGPFLGRLAIGGRRVGSREDALALARKRHGLAHDDIDRVRNNLRLIRATIASTWWLGTSRLAENLAGRVLGAVGDDTDLTRAELLALIAALRRAGFQPGNIATAVLAGEGRRVTLERYGETLWCYLPAWPEIRRQADRFLRGRSDVPAHDLMTALDFPAPDYLFLDYETAPIETVADTAAVSTRLLEMRLLGLDTLPG